MPPVTSLLADVPNELDGQNCRRAEKGAIPNLHKKLIVQPFDLQPPPDSHHKVHHRVSRPRRYFGDAGQVPLARVQGSAAHLRLPGASTVTRVDRATGCGTDKNDRHAAAEVGGPRECYALPRRP